MIRKSRIIIPIDNNRLLIRGNNLVLLFVTLLLSFENCLLNIVRNIPAKTGMLTTIRKAIIINKIKPNPMAACKKIINFTSKSNIVGK